MNDCKVFIPVLTDFLKALANEKRQEILLNIFANNESHNISEVARMANIAQSTASEHLALLKRAGILTSKKIEKEVYYRFNREGVIATLDELRLMLDCCK